MLAANIVGLLMKISTLLTIAILTVSGVAVLQSAKSAVFAYKNSQTVQSLRELVELRGLWFEELTSLSLERSYSQVQLSLEPDEDDAVAALRAQQREKSDAKFAEIKSVIASLEDFPMRAEVMGDTDAALQTIHDNHNLIDQLVALPLKDRSMVVGETAIDDIKSQIVEMRGMTVHIVVPNELTSTQALLLMRLQETVFDVREYAGRARSMYAIATLHGRTMTPSELTYVDTNLTRAREAWRGIEHIKETIPIPDAVNARIMETETQFEAYLALLAKLKKEMKAAKRAAVENGDVAEIATTSIIGGEEALDPSLPVTYTISFDDYFKQSGDTLANLSDLIKAVSVSLDEIWQQRDYAQQNNMILNIIALVVTFAIMIATLQQVSAKITRKLKVKLDELAALTAGEIDHTLSQDKRDLDEVKSLTRGLEDLQLQLQSAAGARAELVRQDAAQKHIVDRLSYGLKSLSSGNLATRLDDEFDPKYQSLADDYNAATKSLSDVVSKVIDTSGSVLSGARGINEATVDLSKRTETQGVTLQSAAEALEMLTQSIVGSRNDAETLDTLAGLAQEKGQAMTQTMSQTVAAIEKIKSSSHQIDRIVGVIEDIAFQTNLLALNAGVEATRAGAEGSGFAVIASEVRSLASRSSQSANEIKALISASGVEVAKGVEFVTEAEASVSDISEHIQKITALISRIATNTAAQSEGLTQVNQGVSQLDLVTQTNVAMVEETTAECQSLSLVAQDLSHLVSRFHIDTDAGSMMFDSAPDIAKVA
jgi:methyl-accepting chemotaxis protein